MDREKKTEIPELSQRTHPHEHKHMYKIFIYVHIQWNIFIIAKTATIKYSIIYCFAK